MHDVKQLQEMLDCINAKRRRGEGCLYLREHSRFIWMKYPVHGRSFQQSTGTDDPYKAERKLDAKVRSIQHNEFIEPKVERLTVDDLAPALFRDYRINEQTSVDDVDARWRLHLQPYFGHIRATNVTTDLISAYVDKRLSEAAANATVNRELAALKRMFNLAYEAEPPKVRRVPHFPYLEEDNVRTGFVEAELHDKLAAACGKVGLWMRAMFECGFTYGWRLSELTNLRVRQIDLLNRVIRLDPGTTKNKRGRTVTMTANVHVLLQACMVGKKPEDNVFTWPDGSPVKTFYGTWAKCCEEAGVPGLLFHDLRRTAVRNMVRAGVPENQAMKISGHKTRSMLDRYDIVSERDIAESVRKIENFHRITAEKSREETVTVSVTGRRSNPVMRAQIKSLKRLGAGRGGRTPMAARAGGF